MAGWTDSYENKVGEHFFRNSVQAPDAALYLELLTAAPADDGTGGTEVSGGSYARQPISFAAPANGEALSSNAQDFGTSSAAWGTVTHFAIRNHVSAGSRIAWGALTTPLAVSAAGSSVAFAIGSVKAIGPRPFTIPYRNKVLSHFLRNVSQTPDAAIYFALYTSAPNEDGTGGTECAASWYARKALAFGAWAAGVGQNSGLVSFVANALTTGGVLTHGCIFNASTGGAMLYADAFSVSLSAGVGSTVDFPIGQISLAID